VGSTCGGLIEIGTGAPHATIHALGVKRADGSTTYVFVYEDGSAMLTTNLQAA